MKTSGAPGFRLKVRGTYSLESAWHFQISLAFDVFRFWTIAACEKTKHSVRRRITKKTGIVRRRLLVCLATKCLLVCLAFSDIVLLLSPCAYCSTHEVKNKGISSKFKTHTCRKKGAAGGKLLQHNPENTAYSYNVKRKRRISMPSTW